ncbi:hypothetical protein [Mesoflavibacter sp. CH_XMU1422-2]|uniref:hypothetical protein n=1 Tax=Mesoflavibacter sp. CH_XMU1422-2 TaxID=3107770 RepID=UPI0030085871
MKKSKQGVFLLVLILSMMNCKSSKIESIYFKNRTPQNIKNKLKTNGFYYLSTKENVRLSSYLDYGIEGLKYGKKYTVNGIKALSFYEDGIIFMSDGVLDGITKNSFKDKCNVKYDNSTDTALRFFNCFINKKGNNLKIKNKKVGYWIYGDSIKIQYEFYNNMKFYLAEKKGFIINDTLFKFVSYIDNKTHKREVINEIYKFKKRN